MAVDRLVWERHVEASFPNSYPCPRCERGRVHRGKNPVVMVQPYHSERLHTHENWGPEWDEMSFTTMLTCDRSNCGEVVAVSGRTFVEPFNMYDTDEDEVAQSGYETWLRPASMYPPPPLFPLPKYIPLEVREELQLAFQLYWTNLSSSTSRIRTSLERILDERGIPTTKISKKDIVHRLNLSERIELFSDKYKDVDSAESLDALRNVGNVGAHGDQVGERDYFDMLDVYEDALLEIYGHKTMSLKEKKASLMALK